MNYYNEDRWYHGFFYLVTVTNILAFLYCWMTEWTRIPVVIAFGAMGFFSGICFLAESAVMGLTAKAGAFFWMCVTGILVCKFLPL